MAWRTNVEGTANVLAAAESAAASAGGVERFIYISSVAVYGVNRAPLIDESMPTPPVGQLYPDSKIAAEALVRASSLPWVIVRPASTYGPQRRRVDGRADRADQGRPVGVVGKRYGVGDDRLHRQRG